MGPLKTCSKPCYFDLILTILDPFWGSWREAAARPVQAAFGLEDLFGASQTHAGTSNFGHFDHFSYWKSQFLSFCLSGVSENAILTLFWALLSPNLWPWPKCAYLGPLPGWTLEGPSGTLNLTLIWPFWILRVLEEAAARPRTSCLWAGGTCSEPLKPMPGPQILVILTTFPIEKSQFCHFAYQGSVKMPFWPHFEPSWAQLFGPGKKCAYLLPLTGWTLEGPSGT